jgi:hypothetical protein
VDNSIPASFVGRRFKRIIEKEGSIGLDLFLIWAVEDAFKTDFLNSLEDGISFPAETRREYAFGLNKLAHLDGDPLKSLRARWSSQDLEIPNYGTGATKGKLKEFVEGTENCRAVFRASPTEAYMDEAAWQRFGKLEDTIRKVAKEIKIKDKEKLGKRGEHNDADIFSKAYSLAYKMPVQILTGDRHFIGIHEEVYKNEALIAAVTDTVSPIYPVTIILDKPKRPWIQRRPIVD